jgi:hypothetical protein
LRFIKSTTVVSKSVRTDGPGGPAPIRATLVLCRDSSGLPGRFVALAQTSEQRGRASHGRHGVGRSVMGNSAAHILRHATVPVLLVRAPENEAGPGKKETAQAGLPTEDLAFE